VSAVAQLLAEAATELKCRRLQERCEEAELVFAAAWEAMVSGEGSEADCHAAADRLRDLETRLTEEDELRWACLWIHLDNLKATVKREGE